MRITISQQLKPFSHHPGTFCVLPGSSLRLQFFPALVRICDITSRQPKLLAEYPINIQGPVKDFTLQQDLERGMIKVWGLTEQGYMRYSCRAETHNSCVFEVEKSPVPVLADWPMLSTKAHSNKLPIERLSLGNHKALDWDMIKRRRDLKEIFPIWYQLGQLVPFSDGKREGTLALLNFCEESLKANKPEFILENFKALFMAGFEGMMSPRVEDTDFHGLMLPSVQGEVNPLALISQGAALIRRLFIQQKGMEIALLPSLPPEFHSGRMLGIRCDNLGLLDIEWSKKELKKVIVRPKEKAEVSFLFQKSLKSYRLRLNVSDKGNRISCGQPIILQPDIEYFFDNFQR